MNCVLLKGRLVRDPDIRYSQADKSLCIASFTLAVNRPFAKKDNKDEQQADFISCKAFGKTGELVEKYLGKGREICIRGQIQTGSYTNKDGNKVYTTDVRVDELDFCGNKNDSSSNTNKATTNNSGDGFMNIPDGMDEELPFN